jgi:hypothetical protein
MVDDFQTVSFRIRKVDLNKFQYISDVLYQAKGLKRPSIGLLAKKCLYAESNQFFQSQYFAFMSRATQLSSDREKSN